MSEEELELEKFKAHMASVLKKQKIKIEEDKKENSEIFKKEDKTSKEKEITESTETLKYIQKGPNPKYKGKDKSNVTLIWEKINKIICDVFSSNKKSWSISRYVLTIGLSIVLVSTIGIWWTLAIALIAIAVF